MPSYVSADPDIAKAGAVHNTALDVVQEAMSALASATFQSRPVDKLGNPLEPDPDQRAVAEESRDVLIERALEEAHRRRVVAGTAQSSEAYVARAEEQAAAAAAPSLVATLSHELSALCARLGELRANYMIQERALMAQIEQTATRVQLAREMSK